MKRRLRIIEYASGSGCVLASCGLEAAIFLVTVDLAQYLQELAYKLLTLVRTALYPYTVEGEGIKA